jgi:hypothetical protein
MSWCRPSVAERSEAGFLLGDRRQDVRRSRVDRARRSRRVTISTSPASSWASTRRRARSVFAPLATSRNTWRAPAALSSRTWASMLWPSVDMRA